MTLCIHEYELFLSAAIELYSRRALTCSSCAFTFEINIHDRFNTRLLPSHTFRIHFAHTEL